MAGAHMIRRHFLQALGSALLLPTEPVIEAPRRVYSFLRGHGVTVDATYRHHFAGTVQFKIGDGPWEDLGAVTWDGTFVSQPTISIREVRS